MPITYSSGSTVTFPAPQFHGRLTAGDFDGDGDIDFLYQTGGNTSAWQYARSNGDGTYTILSQGDSPFADVTLPDHTGSNHYLGDYDGDGDLDLWVAANGSRGAYFVNDGDGTFSAGSSGFFPAASFHARIIQGDFDGDGDTDILYQTGADGTAWQYARAEGDANFTLLSQADSPFAAVTLLNHTGSNYHAADFDGDGDIDLYAAANSATGSFYGNDGAGAFTAGSTLTFPAAQFHGRVTSGDFDSDGDADFLYQTGGNGSAWQYARSNGDGTFTILNQAASPFAGLTLPDHSGANYVAGDFDGDGDADLYVAANVSTGTVFYASGKPPEIASSTPSDNGTGVAATANIVLTFDETVSKGSGNIYIYRGDGVLIETISVTSAQVTGSGATWTIDPSVTLAGLTNYYVLTDDGIFVDGDGSIFAGVSDPTALNFTTASTNTAPTIGNLNGDAIGYTEGLAANRLDAGSNATVSDAEQANFNGGTLTVSITANGVAAEDVLTIANTGNGVAQIGVSGAAVNYQGVQIGTFTGGTGGADLVVTFDADATPAAVQALVRALQYRNSNAADPSEATRSVSIVLTDGAGGTSATRTVSVSVLAINDAPVNGVPAGPIAAAEDGPAVTVSGLSVNDVDADPATDVIVVTLSVTDGVLTIDTAVSGGLGAGDVSGDGTATVTLTGTQDAINATLASAAGVQFQSTTAGFSGSVTLTMTTNDQGATGADPGETGSAGSEEDQDTVVIEVAAVNDEPAGADAAATIDEDAAYLFTASDFGFTDPEGGAMAGVVVTTLPTDGEIQVRLAGVWTTVAAGAEISMAQLVAGEARFLPGANEFGTGYASFTFQVRDDGGTANGGVDADQTPNTFTFDVTAVNDAPVLTGVTSPGAFLENALNAAPQLIGFDVSVSDAENGFDQGGLIVGGVIGDDEVSIRDQGMGPGQIGFDAATGDVFYGGVLIGVATGGCGCAPFDVAFNASATAAAIEAVIENLTFSNSSDTPVASRQLTLTVFDGDGLPALGDNRDLVTVDPDMFGGAPTASHTLIDLDNDGDLDLVFQPDGLPDYTPLYMINHGTAAAPDFQFAPLPDLFGGALSNVVALMRFVDIEGDGDVDLVAQDFDTGQLLLFRSGATGFEPIVDTTADHLPDDVEGYIDFADLDGDGDQDMILGDPDGGRYLENEGGGVFTERTGADNPFSGIGLDGPLGFMFGDVDGDGDLDMVTGSLNPIAGAPGFGQYFENVGTASAPQFVERIDGANPFFFLPAELLFLSDLADVNGDGYADLTLSDSSGLVVFGNGQGFAHRLDITITAEDDAPVAADDLDTVAESATRSGSVFGNDVDPDGDALTVSAVNGSAASVGTQITLASGALLTLNADGTYSYDPNGAFAHLSGSASGGSNLVQDDSFTYTLANGNTATVTLSVVGEDSAGDIVQGGVGPDILDAGDGDDTVAGGLGADTLNGGAGSDTADYGGAAGGVIARINAGGASNDGDGGSDVFTSIENLTGSAFNDILVGAAGGNVLSGGDGYDTLVGLDGNDVLRGGSGAANQLQGGQGDDDYHVDANDTIIELAGQGHDRIFTSRDRMTLVANVEELRYTGSGAFIGTGNGLDNTLVGAGGADVLYGAAGSDTLQGAGGSDTADYSRAASGVLVDVAVGASIDGDGGSDTFVSIENVIGTAFADTMVGNNAANTLDGGAGDDVLAGSGGNDVLRGGLGVDTATYANALLGVVVKLNAGVAQNDGFGGSDQLIGIENLTGGAFGDTLVGSAAANVINGGAGRDLLIGLAGNDSLNGGAGDANELFGGEGDDFYFVEAADTIVELAGQGTDTVHTNRNQFVLAANVENLQYTGSGDFAGVGNASNNVITGGAGRDTLTGGAGNDTLNGGDGRDTAQFSGSASEYQVEDLGGGQYRVTDLVGGRDGVDILNGMEQLRFLDGVVALGGSAAPALSAKDAGGPQVLPTLADDAFVLPKDLDLPQVLPDDGGADGWAGPIFHEPARWWGHLPIADAELAPDLGLPFERHDDWLI